MNYLSRRNFIALALAGASIKNDIAEASFSPAPLKFLDIPREIQGAIVCKGSDLENLLSVRRKTPAHYLGIENMLIPFGTNLHTNPVNDPFLQLFVTRFKDKIIAECHLFNQIQTESPDCRITTTPCFDSRELAKVRIEAPREYWDKFTITMPWELTLIHQRNWIHLRRVNTITGQQSKRTWGIGSIIENAECAAVQFLIEAEGFRRELYSVSTHRDRTLGIKYPTELLR